MLPGPSMDDVSSLDVMRLRAEIDRLENDNKRLTVKLAETADRNLNLLNDISVYGLLKIDLDDDRRKRRLAKKPPQPLGIGLLELWQIERIRRQIAATGACVTESAGQAGVALHVVHKGCHHDTFLGKPGQRARLAHWRKALEIVTTFVERDKARETASE